MNVYHKKEIALFYMRSIIEGNDMQVNPRAVLTLRAAHPPKHPEMARAISGCSGGADVNRKSVKRAYTSGEHHRSSISRALNSQPGAKVSFCDVTAQLTKIDKETFLQIKTDEIHLFYRKETLKLAMKELGCKAQLYGLHGVCGDAQAKPLVYAITTNKLTAKYLKIFQHVAPQLEKYGANINDINVILDFETSAHNAAEQVFNKDKVVGRMFHFGMAFVRNVHSKGLSSFTEGKSNPGIVLYQKLMDEEEATNNFLYNRVVVSFYLIKAIVTNYYYRTSCLLDLFANGMPKDAMLRFDAKISSRSSTPSQVSRYLEKMSCFISAKRK
ncbi:hypothetical protein WR25_07956 [Diploscapter pachys]|uniref:MULE transposase domain-containing protein n=1 Tax=Diploscapter pachys TaxID=2018661 RepID=A0A2A2KKK8_9BILA|nr:hypothetical protein WR25_07956 [Diploscapter pachys]